MQDGMSCMPGCLNSLRQQGLPILAHLPPECWDYRYALPHLLYVMLRTKQWTTVENQQSRVSPFAIKTHKWPKSSFCSFLPSSLPPSLFFPSFQCVFGLYVCLCIVCMAGACRGQRRTSDPGNYSYRGRELPHGCQEGDLCLTGVHNCL